MIDLLEELFFSFGDYSQSLGYIASLLLLLMEKDQAKKILFELNFNDKYIPGYWKAEAVAFGRDGYVFQSLLEKFHPAVAKHLAENGILPTTYAQKWFSGLCIHVLDFESLFPFFDNFFKEGYPFLFRFGLSVVNVLKDQILAAKSPTTIFELLRLDSKNKDIPEEIGKKIMEIATSDEYKDLGDLEEMRKIAYETKIKPQLEAAKKRREELDDVFFFFFFSFLIS